MPLLIAIFFLLGACTSTWRAPLDNRSAPSRHVAPSVRGVARPVVNSTFYRVRKGDTLFSIAWRANRDFRQLARWNGIRSPYVIYVGQVVRLQPISSSGKKRSVSSLSSSKSGRTDHTRQDTVHRRAATKKKTITATGKLHWRWPSAGKVVATYKSGDPLRKGIKLAGREGSAVRAAEAGKVVYSGSGLIGYGRLIIIKHNDKYLSAYGHNRKLLVKQDQQVTKGQQIAEMGTANDGRALLHFEIRRDGRPINPLRLLPRR